MQVKTILFFVLVRIEDSEKLLPFLGQLYQK